MVNPEFLSVNDSEQRLAALRGMLIALQSILPGINVKVKVKKERREAGDCYYLLATIPITDTVQITGYPTLDQNDNYVKIFDITRQRFIPIRSAITWWAQTWKEDEFICFADGSAVVLNNDLVLEHIFFAEQDNANLAHFTRRANVRFRAATTPAVYLCAVGEGYEEPGATPRITYSEESGDIRVHSEQSHPHTFLYVSKPIKQLLSVPHPRADLRDGSHVYSQLRKVFPMKTSSIVITFGLGLAAAFLATWQSPKFNYLPGANLLAVFFYAIAAYFLWFALVAALLVWRKWFWTIPGVVVSAAFPLFAPLLFPHQSSYTSVLPLSVMYVLPLFALPGVALVGYFRRSEVKYDVPKTKGPVVIKLR